MARTLWLESLPYESGIRIPLRVQPREIRRWWGMEIHSGVYRMVHRWIDCLLKVIMDMHKIVLIKFFIKQSIQGRRLFWMIYILIGGPHKGVPLFNLCLINVKAWDDQILTYTSFLMICRSNGADNVQ